MTKRGFVMKMNNALRSGMIVLLHWQNVIMPDEVLYFRTFKGVLRAKIGHRLWVNVDLEYHTVMVETPLPEE